MERREAPGSCVRLPWQACEARLRTHGDIPVTEDRRFGVRAASDVGRCASRGSTAMPIVGHRTSLRHQASRDDALDERGCAKNKCENRAGITFSAQMSPASRRP